MQHAVTQRINFLVNHYSNGIVAQFSNKLVGVNQQSVNRIFNPDPRTGNYPTPSTELLISICSAFPEINANWLLMGQGEPFETLNQENKPERGKQYDDGRDWKLMYFEILEEKDLLTKKYMALLEKVAKP